MTPELLIEGDLRREWLRAKAAFRAGDATASGGRAAGFGRPVARGQLDAAHGAVLYLDELRVAFDGFKALNGLSLTIAAGELRCVIGPNGAGKTTMMDVITGKTRPDSGHAFFGSTIDLLRLREPAIAQLGIGRKFQKPTVYERLSVFDNLELSLAGERGVVACIAHRLDAAGRARIDEVLALTHLAPDARRPAGELSHGRKQWLEIGMLLVQDPKLLLLDEPVAGMTDDERARTAEMFDALVAGGARSLVVVEHDMDFVERLAGRHRPGRRVTVLHEGAVLAEGPLDAVRADPRVVEVYLGR